MDREELEQTICAALLLDPIRARLRDMRYEIGLTADDFEYQAHKDIWENMAESMFNNCLDISDPHKLIREAAIGVISSAGYRGIDAAEAKSYMRQLADCGVVPEDAYQAALALRLMNVREQIRELQEEETILQSL